MKTLTSDQIAKGILTNRRIRDVDSNRSKELAQQKRDAEIIQTALDNALIEVLYPRKDEK